MYIGMNNYELYTPEKCDGDFCPGDCDACPKVYEGAPDEVESLVAYFDIVEEHDNCHVQVLRNSQTGEVSVGWWPNHAEPAAEDAP